MKKILYITILIVFLIGLKLTVFSQSGQLDPTFGEGGIVMYDLSGNFHETIWDMEILADSTILTCGTINNGAVTVTDGFLMKLDTQGNIDETWGNNGLITFAMGEDTYAYKLKVLSDGSILAAGTAVGANYDSEFFAAKFNEDGTPDTAFGENGAFVGSYSDDYEEGYCMTVQTDGKIVLAGKTGYATGAQMLFARLNSDGSLDLDFGNGGYSEINASGNDEVIQSLSIMSDGSIIGAGYAYKSGPYYANLATLVKLNPDGSPAIDFGTNGILIPSWATSNSEINDVEIRNDSIFVTGYIQLTDFDLFLAKFDAAGNFDPAFGNDGITLFNNDILDNAFDLYFGLDQKIYICGNTGLYGPGAAKDFLLIRYHLNGNIDLTFNETGFVTTQIRVDSDAAFSVKMQQDGKMVLAGMSSGISTSQMNNVALTRYQNDYLPLNAGFAASSGEICKGETVEFTDLSVGNITNWSWYFEGGTPENSTDQNPMIQYDTAGIFDVLLIIYDGVNSDTLFAENLILVNECTGISEKPEPIFEVFPNPVTGTRVTVLTDNLEYAGNLTIVNATGQVLVDQKMVETQTVLDFTHFNKGIYFVKISDIRGVDYIKKILVQ